MIVIALIVLVSGIVLPQFWVRHVLKKHGAEREDFPGTGGELAQHLIERFDLEGVSVEVSDSGDHYDPEDKTVRLSQGNFDGASLTAVAIAAHEVGHALQDARGDGGLKTRGRLVTFTAITDRFARVFFLVAPLLGIFLQTPRAFLIFVVLGIGFMAMRVLVHLITLPVEFDASFTKALPILQEGGYLSQEDMPAAKSVLRAAALTYVAGALMSLVNLASWIRMIR